MVSNTSSYSPRSCGAKASGVASPKFRDSALDGPIFSISLTRFNGCIVGTGSSTTVG